jgi:3-oxoacyl-[acyl-carrier-protein] synthase II
LRIRTVITGMGVVTPIGIGLEAFWESLIQGRSGVGRITRFDPDGFRCRIAGEVKGFDPTPYIEAKDLKRMILFTQYACVASKMAIEDAGLELERIDPKRVGVYIGSGIGGLEVMEEEHKRFIEEGPRRIGATFIPKLIIDIAAGWVSILFGFKGPNLSCVTACATGAHAIGEAYRIIQRGDADVMIAGGTEAAITPLALAGFSASRSLSSRNEEPNRASRPFDLERDGFVMGEGAGILVLESSTHAMARGAHVYAEVVGYGLSGDAYHLTAPCPDGEGAALAMEMALRDAGLHPQDIGYINAHGTSTQLNDKVETDAIKRVFGDYAYRIPISSTKSMTGHMLGAAGGVELVASALTIERGKIHPTINYERPDPQCDLDYVPNEAREAEVDVALSNSFGFGGHNAVLIIRRFNGEG